MQNVVAVHATCVCGWSLNAVVSSAPAGAPRICVHGEADRLEPGAWSSGRGRESREKGGGGPAPSSRRHALAASPPGRMRCDSEPSKPSTSGYTTSSTASTTHTPTPQTCNQQRGRRRNAQGQKTTVRKPQGSEGRQSVKHGVGGEGRGGDATMSAAAVWCSGEADVIFIKVEFCHYGKGSSLSAPPAPPPPDPLCKRRCGEDRLHRDERTVTTTNKNNKLTLPEEARTAAAHDCSPRRESTHAGVSTR